ncbi:cupin domain-containing protein [Paenibacillus xanthanilyticus]|uniref:Cupin domain-containing protein n=1 Tax=Paenibacillus xanthanilyticus TaxID=1783531 RepID=A0ABV8K6U8_9BACL
MDNFILKTPGLTLSADSTEVVNAKRDSKNYITQLFGEQLPAIENGFFNAHMSKGMMVNPHWHTNTTEMVFVICGELITSVFNPFTQKLMTYRLKPGQVSIFPKGWFHWIVALSDKTHFLTIFDQPTPDIVFGADLIRSAKDVVHRAFCVNEEEYAKAIAPIKEAVIFGPPKGCDLEDGKEDPDCKDAGPYQPAWQAPQYGQPPYGQPYYGGGYAVAGPPSLGYGAPSHPYQRNLMTDTLQAIEPWVQSSLQEARDASAEQSLREAAAVANLIAKGCEPAVAHQIVESWFQK